MHANFSFTLTLYTNMLRKTSKISISWMHLKQHSNKPKVKDIKFTKHLMLKPKINPIKVLLI